MKAGSAILFAAIAITLSGFCANTQLTLEQKRARERDFIAMMGGEVTEPPTGSAIRIVNAQNQVPESCIVKFAEDFNGYWPVKPVVTNLDKTGKNPFALIKEGFAIPKTGCLILLVEDEQLPTILIAPESGYGIINVSALKADNPESDLLKDRVRKELWRSSALAFGGCNSLMVPCILVQARNLKELDAIGTKTPGPEPYRKVLMTLPRFDVRAPRRSLYKLACQEGWAPPPTNEVQAAIWKEFQAKKADKADPTNRWKRDFEKK